MILRFRSPTDVKMPRDDVALDLGEPELDLIQPRRVRGREVQLHTAMPGEERPHRLCLVGREIVENDVDLAPRRLRSDDVREERQKVGARVPRGGLPDHLAGLGVQRGVEREGAVSLVFEAVALRSAGRQREARVDAVERSNRRLCVETEHPRRAGGGARYRPSTSAAFVSKSASVDRMYRSILGAILWKNWAKP